MTSGQLVQLSTLAILDDMVTNIQSDPLTGQLQGGAIWISSNIQRMADFEVKPYVSQ